MKRTTGLVTTGALALGSTALLGAVAPGVASASGCGLTTLDQAGLEAAFNSFYSGAGGGAESVVEADGLRMKAAAEGESSVGWFMDVEIPLAEATAESNVALDATVVGDDVAHHPTYELLVDLDGAAGHEAWTWLVLEPQYQGERSGLWWSSEPLEALYPDDPEAVDEGTLPEISAAYPDAVVTTLGFQLGIDQAGAEAVVHGLTFGCNEFRFAAAAPEDALPTAAIAVTNPRYATYLFSGAGSHDADGDLAAYRWDLGDGSTAEGADIEHSYAAPGSYTVTLTVVDGTGNEATATAEVVVPATPTVWDTPLPNTGADVLGLAAVGGLVLLGGGAGLVATHRRRPAADRS
ncbi:PKD domain-containing protein [Geodermatophilus chilensis]|uniref:PKD domain-containing protein n=1 Tax=Geodermatophilus chilensis TaxID=2035835 RepID=UPI000C2670D2|nr:PKD domain-containing protein [Geodermatophilus chilensis]